MFIGVEIIASTMILISIFLFRKKESNIAISETKDS